MLSNTAWSRKLLQYKNTTCLSTICCFFSLYSCVGIEWVKKEIFYEYNKQVIIIVFYEVFIVHHIALKDFWVTEKYANAKLLIYNVLILICDNPILYNCYFIKSPLLNIAFKQAIKTKMPKMVNEGQLFVLHFLLKLCCRVRLGLGVTL